jgi:hypothetical protein
MQNRTSLETVRFGRLSGQDPNADSGCAKTNLKQGELEGRWQVVPWWKDSESTFQRTIMVRWPASFIDMKPGAAKKDLLFDFYVVDNNEQAGFFDLKSPKRSYFRFNPDNINWEKDEEENAAVISGFRFVNSYVDKPNHHIRVRVNVGYPQVVCR